MKYRRNNGSQMPPEGWHYARIASVREGKQANTQLGPSETALVTFVIEGDVPRPCHAVIPDGSVGEFPPRTTH
jgi:hypothetical protein